MKKYGKKNRACDGSHARSKIKFLRKNKETGTGDNTQTRQKYVELENGGWLIRSYQQLEH